MHGLAALRRAASVLLVAYAIAACAGVVSSPGSNPVSSTGPSTTRPLATPTGDPAGEVPITVTHTLAGLALAGPNGKTLYIRTTDRNGTSTCTNGPCSRAWGALVSDPADLRISAGITGTFGITIWGDGTQQVTHNGQPLYFYSKDVAAGEARGEGAGNVWCIAQITTEPGCGAVAAPEARFLIPDPAQRAADSADDY